MAAFLRLLRLFFTDDDGQEYVGTIEPEDDDEGEEDDLEDELRP